MKLIIDISDEDYKFIKDLQSLIIGGRGNCKTIQKNVINALYNGTPYNLSGDLISREALKKAISEATYNFEQIPIRVDKVQEIIDNAPTVEYTFEEAFQKTVCENRLYCPARPQGEWYYNYQNGWHCSICHETVKDMPTVKGKADYNFCPRCGADMRGNKNGKS